MRTASESWLGRIDSHQRISHDSIRGLGYDWSKVAEPDIGPLYPAKLYLARSTADVVSAVRETRQLGQQLRVRSKGHSSNNLVLSDGGAVLLTQLMDGIIGFDPDRLRITVQAGATNAALDDWLAERGFGLPVVGDHKDITVGGFVSMGGISPTSHRLGLFVEHVVELEYVDGDGQVYRCGPADDPQRYWRVAGGLGRAGVITEATLEVIAIDKYRTVLATHTTRFPDFDTFVRGTRGQLADLGDCYAARGMWLDTGSFSAGQFSSYRSTPQTAWKSAIDKVGYGTLHAIGLAAGTVPASVDKALKLAGMAGTLHGPAFATMKNVEFFTDKLIDTTVGDPSRMLITLVPLSAYEALLPRLWQLVGRYRHRHGCFTFLTCYVKGIRSPYLGEEEFAEVTYLLGIRRGAFPDSLLSALVEEFDELVIDHGALRYMHTRTVADPARRALIDPNLRHLARMAVPGEDA
ncbi:FAD-binding oxidoreductase [Propionicimonas sp.]|uniref:FAD-binding oxidoreductase n=1 Tax=Propionicimonas sp. TaxID=1955623 RepID=UPI0039E4E492